MKSEDIQQLVFFKERIPVEWLLPLHLYFKFDIIKSRYRSSPSISLRVSWERSIVWGMVMGGTGGPIMSSDGAGGRSGKAQGGLDPRYQRAMDGTPCLDN